MSKQMIDTYKLASIEEPLYEFCRRVRLDRNMIRKIVLSFLFVVCVGQLFAQTSKDSVRITTDNIIYKEVGAKLNIKDKIIIQNNSPYLIMQVMVALPTADNGFEPLGTSTYITPNEVRTIASYTDNGLKNFRGKTIAIKVKGAKIVLPESGTDVFTPYGSVSVQHKDIDPNIINNIKSEDITYDFDAKLFEANHDLYIQIFYKGDYNKSNVMDF